MGKNKDIFVTSDLWFNRPMGDFSHMTNEEYNNMIIHNWNNVVGKNDIVYVLGGFGIGDCYDIVIKLNGEIHFLNSVFTYSDSIFMDAIKNSVVNSINKILVNKIIFENNQILALPNFDCVLSYFPLNDWIGKSTNTFCFHGYTDKHNLKENNVSCKFELWNNSPVRINEIKDSFLKFEKFFM
jgi:calcineurin-like phosphoesterase family protein